MNTHNQIYVWDLFVRLFHWSMALLFFVAYMTGDEKGALHRYVGYAILGLVVVRLFWGFVGTEHARFSDFICSPVKAWTYLKDLAAGNPRHYTGHNPAAAWMVIFLLTSSLVVCLSGYAAYATKKMPPLLGFSTDLSFIANAYADEDEGQDAESDEKGENEDVESDSIWGDIHEISAQFMLLLLFLHVLGVAVSSRMHNENLVKSMITGKKDIYV